MGEKRRLSADVLEGPVRGRRLRGRTLGQELGDETTLVVFLRHFG
jgi:hypothetical protein